MFNLVMKVLFFVFLSSAFAWNIYYIFVICRNINATSLTTYFITRNIRLYREKFKYQPNKLFVLNIFMKILIMDVIIILLLLLFVFIQN